MNFKEKRERKSSLTLADGVVFNGYSVGAVAQAKGEVVFNTSSSAYMEIFSDPANAGKIMVMTAPEIGNCGFNPEDMKSDKFCIAGLVVRELNEPSSWKSQGSLGEALAKFGIPAIAGVDTRALVLHIREKSPLKATIEISA